MTFRPRLCRSLYPFPLCNQLPQTSFLNATNVSCYFCFCGLGVGRSLSEYDSAQRLPKLQSRGQSCCSLTQRLCFRFMSCRRHFLVVGFWGLWLLTGCVPQPLHITYSSRRLFASLIHLESSWPWGLDLRRPGLSLESFITNLVQTQSR